jgi:eukaryotic-like serine/threonine-protein kinase
MMSDRTLPGVGQAGGELAHAEPRAADDGTPPARTAAEVAETLVPDAVAATLDAPNAATLPGPYTVADLPELPRIDDASYAIGEELARGGMGRILLARDRRLRRDVVIKVRRGDAGRVDPRFEREALITARLQHPSIVRVYDAGVLGDGRVFYTMERVRGRSFDVVIEEAATLRDRLALLPHAIAVADAIAYAHSEGVLHRDLKPANILIGPFGETVVIDWGLAKDQRAGETERDGAGARANTASDGSLTQHGSVLGTPAFMAPEQARGEPSDERTDIYALGALLYTTLTGKLPHGGRTTDEILDRVAAGEHVPITEREPALPPELATIVEHAMAADPAARFASAKDLAEELRRFAAGKLVTTHSYSTWTLIKRWAARHRVAVTVAASALVVLAGGGALAVANVMRERDAAEQARGEAERQRAAAQHARAEAEGKFDTFVHGRARVTLDDDPSRSAAWLKHHSDRALGWPETVALAGEASARGLAHELRGHTQDVEIVVASPTGTHVATGSDDGTARWWNLADRTSLELRGHDGPLEAVVVSRTGGLLVSGGTDHKIRVWDLTTGGARTLEGHRHTVRGLALSPDETRLASTSEDGTLWIWDVASGTGRPLVKHSHGLRPVLWFDDATILVGAHDGRLGRFDAATGRGALTRRHDAGLRALAVSPDRSYLAIGDEDGHVSLWTTSGALVRRLGRHQDVARFVVFTPDGKHVVSGGGDALVRVHAIPDGPTVELAGNRSGIKGLALSPDGSHVASGGIDGTVRVWTVSGEPVRTLHGHGAAVKAVAFVSDTVLVSGAEDDRARIWRLAPAEPPPAGPALRAWLARQTNVEIRTFESER